MAASSVIWDHLTSATAPAEDPGILAAWKQPTEEKTVSELEKLQQATVANAQMLNHLIQQNAQTNQGIQLTNQTLQQGFQRLAQPPPAPEPAADIWGATPPPGKKAQQQPSVSAEDIQRLVAESVQKGFQQHQQTYTELQNQTQMLDNHFRQNYPELMPHYDLVKERFGVEAQRTDLQTAYVNAVNWAKAVAPRLAPPQPQRQAQAPAGGGSDWVPNTTAADGKEVVSDKAGQKYVIERYMDGVPLVQYGKDKEKVHLDRFEKFRNDHYEMRRGTVSPKEFQREFPEYEYLGMS